MPQKKHKPEEIVAKLRQVDVLLSQGRSVGEAVRLIGVTQFTYYRWRKEFGGLKGDQVKRLKELDLQVRAAVERGDAQAQQLEGELKTLREQVGGLAERLERAERERAAAQQRQQQLEQEILKRLEVLEQNKPGVE